MKILVTGGAGFIGSHLVDALIARGDEVTVLDDFSTGRRENLSHLSDCSRLQILDGTVLDQDLLTTRVRAADCIFHLASAVGVKLVFNQPVKSIETTVEGTAKVFKAARRYEKPVLLTSTSEVYGRGSQIPFTEHHDVVLGSTSSRRWFYACSKMLDECLALGHWFEAALPVICVRLFNTVGPRQLGSYGMVLPNFVRQAMSGAPITIFGDGKQSRCFCHVADAVGAIVRLMDYRDRTAGKVINIGNNEEITIRQLAECVKEVLESPSDIVYIPYEEAYGAGFEDMRRRVPDLTRARKLIGFCPSFSLDETIRSVADHYRKRGPDTT